TAGGRPGQAGSANGPARGGALGPPTGPGFTADVVTVGVEYLKDLSAGGQQFGARGVDAGDGQAQVRAVVDWINSAGGIAGRKVVPVLHGTDVIGGGTWDAQQQQACTDFSEDHRV